jgi:hypothetical protein
MAERDDLRDPRVSAVYRTLGEDRPPEALDAAILAASRRAVGAGPRRPGFSLRRWALPVSVAAVVVLTMSLVVRVQLERPDLESAARMPAAPPAAEKKAAPRDAKAEVDNLSKRSEARLPEPKAKASSVAPAASAPAPEATQRERQTLRPPAAPAPAAAPPARALVAEPRAPRSAPAQAAAPSQLGAASTVQPGAASSVAGARADHPSSGDAASAGRAVPSAALEDRARASAEQAGKKDESPRDWLERIARLRREGRAKEADESLAEFRRRYPNYEIPKELRDAVLGAGKAD